MAGILGQRAHARKKGLVIDTPRIAPPHRWLAPLAKWLDEELRGARIEGALSGRGWLSLRVSGRFLWLVAQSELRAAWIAEYGIPLRFAEALGKHQRSPLSPLLQDQILAEVHALEDPSGELAALRLRFAGGSALSIRFWPRPGVLWVEDARGKVQSVTPPDAPQIGDGLQELEGDARDEDAQDGSGSIGDAWDEGAAQAHAELCQQALLARLERAVLRRLRDATRGRRRKAERLAQALAKESEEALDQAGMRRQADILASQLHLVRAGQSEAELDDFEGGRVRIPLDPALTPAKNLEKLYRRAGRAERKQSQLERRCKEVESEVEAARSAEASVEGLQGLEAALDLAAQLGIELRPRAPGEHRGRQKPRQPRLPYRIFELSTGREVWVGRGAKDNDELTFRHAAPQDLWFHAGGVEGSHVVLRSLGSEASKAEQEAAAQLAALHSKARGSTTVPVWMTLRRHVRKPRKSPPGTVAPERMQTLFVRPMEPPGSWRRRED